MVIVQQTTGNDIDVTVIDTRDHSLPPEPKKAPTEMSLVTMTKQQSID